MKCEICKGLKGKISKQYCLENPKNPNYRDNEDWIYDCWGFICSNDLLFVSVGRATTEDIFIKKEKTQ